MKSHALFFLITVNCLMVLSGCASEKMTYERGWIGGKYLESNPSLYKKITANYFKTETGVIPILPGKIKERQQSAVFISRVYPDTPATNAGMREGDLIIAVNNQTVEDLVGFYKVVDQSKAGEKILVSVYRNGEIVELPVTVGRETYQKWGYFNLGLRLGTELNPVPTPDFNILNIISYQTNDTRLHLYSPEYKYYHDALALPANETDRKPDSDVDTEGWDAWFGIFGVAGKKIILNQES